MPTAAGHKLTFTETQIEQARAISEQNPTYTFHSQQLSNQAVPREISTILSTVIHAVAQGETLVIGKLPKELTTTEAARQLGISRPTLMKLIASGKIPAHKVGSHSRLKTTDVLDYLKAEHEQACTSFEELRELDESITFEP
ncbi:helix-turn-helix domain-containing protein [Corynebacterium sp. CCM 8864]|uniref:Helix-turn-helix domain-containing protein n=2 Tax=Corynebacterium marambiense TaxID=2765364 RepID=A0ABS0VVL6_9CORY|nr:helix-turn-helix domain-containing protein [Corynebacterium marambiense]MBI8999660.1 helix-turn-helix domain-containing protein [Corynebacterium marambiense]MCX7541788.1 helix-turn-helix domain-containing protein [Corynebacterium marambiense]